MQTFREHSSFSRIQAALILFFLSLLSLFFFLSHNSPFCTPFASPLSNSVMADDSHVSSTTIRHEGMGNNEEMNALQKHVKFFDRNNDGVIYPWETYEGFRAIGSGVMLSGFAAVFINLGLSRKTRPGKGFSPSFPIEIQNIQMSKHGSDSGVYDSEGRFVHSKFEEIFSKHAHTHAHALTSDELSGMLKANREPKDFGGWVGAYSEWKILYMLCKDKEGLLHKDIIKSVYDGSLFEHLAAEKASKKASKKAISSSAV